MGYTAGSESPDNITTGINIGSSFVTANTLNSFLTERISSISKTLGEMTPNTDTEIDLLKIETYDQVFKFTVFNRGVSLFTSNSDELQRMHRFLCVLEKEMAE